MRAFVQLRKIPSSEMQLVQMLREIESRLEDHDEKIEVIFEAIKQLIEIEEKPKKKRIGYTVKEKQAAYRRKRRKGQAKI
jgi:hypothetical protein